MATSKATDDTYQGKAEEAAIGGYFGLEMPRARGRFLVGAVRFQSARAALQALLVHLRPRRLWLPRYNCPVVVESARAADVPISYYSLEGGMGVASNLDIGPQDLVVLIDYFGVCGSTVDEAAALFGAHRVIIDASQALFRRKRDELAVFYSPRKFVGIPDGGLLDTDSSIPLPERVDTGSTGRARHLLMRAGGFIEEGYPEFRTAEASLEGLPPMAMSQLTSRLLDSIDFTRIRQRRRANYAALAERISGLAEFIFPLTETVVPLCLPLVGVDARPLRDRLAQREIFTPRYWPGIEGIRHLNSWERVLCDHTLYLPCDQRYRPDDMERLADVVADAVATLRTPRKRRRFPAGATKAEG